ncbi:MAG: hypothetical protein WC683_02890 [bacterium]
MAFVRLAAVGERELVVYWNSVTKIAKKVVLARGEEYDLKHPLEVIYAAAFDDETKDEVEREADQQIAKWMAAAKTHLRLVKP